MKATHFLLLALALPFVPPPVVAQPRVPGATTSVYAVVPDPFGIAFGADGTLYVGRDNSGSGGGNPDAVKIHRVGPGGSPVTEFGDTAIPDPDVVVVDRTGQVSGIAGAVLVGGQVSPGVGQVSRVTPDGFVTVLFGPSAEYANPSGLALDSLGRLLFTEAGVGRVYRSAGSAPELLFSLPDAYSIVVDGLDRVVVSPASEPGRLLLYSAGGELLDDRFAEVRLATPLVRGMGGWWTTELFGISAAGELVRIGSAGTAVVVGTGFGGIEGLAFGPDGALYGSDFAGDRIWRLAPLTVPEARGFWGLKTHDPRSQPPTTMFWFDEHGAAYRELPRVTLGGVEIEADGLAMSPEGRLFAFQVDAAGGSRLISLDATTAVASVVGPVLSGRDVRGATFTLSGRLLAFDYAGRALVEVAPETGQEVGTAVGLSTNVTFTGTAGDLTQLPDGSLAMGYEQGIYRLDARTGELVVWLEDTAVLPDGFAPYCCGIASVPGSEPMDALFAYEASDKDSVYRYAPSSAFARDLLMLNVVPSYNAGRGDLAALPAALIDAVTIRREGAEVTVAAVCRGGVWAEVLFTDDLGATDWAVAPGTAGWVPYTPGSLATPMTWSGLPASAAHRFYRVRVR